METPTFCTALNCMDGRTQLPVIRYLQKRFGVEFVDCVTAPGINRILAEEWEGETAAAVRRRLEISLERHASAGAAVVGHPDCAGNPVADTEQLEQLRIAVERLRRRYPGVEFVALWVEDNRSVREIAVPSEEA